MKKIKAPTLDEVEHEEKLIKHFAQGINFYKLFWIFFIGCIIGVLIEIVWCLATLHHYESRTGLIYGPFNPVYGFGALALTLSLQWLRDKRDTFILIGGAIIGSAVEYLCSWVQELLFGTISWDYSYLPFNINGRVNLLYGLFWGILTILWIKDLYPLMVKLIMKIPNKIGKPLTWILLVFMVFNCAMSGLAVYRWMGRREGKEPQTAIGAYMDDNYPNERMEKIYPNMDFVK